MKELDHPNIVKMVGVVRDSDTLMVMEFLELGSLPAYLELNKRSLGDRELIKFSCDIASAMEYLEREKIVHRDLAARNILVESESKVKLSDFGLAHHLHDGASHSAKSRDRCLPIKWYAPETILWNIFTIKSDVWSFGVTLWEMFTFGEDPVVVYSANATEIGRTLMDGARLRCPEACPPDVYQIMQKCWASEDELRPSFSSLLAAFQDMVERKKRVLASSRVAG
ncbi:tyrosine-protein kinase SYK-like [Galendromus occidentalis]|uniref:Tyrosine-protein kinase SYK-like n=1 Tax=Galendromus occidentalis TaxID=34638 RepID=A0AAJ7SJ56_9ACAR|nr:tyrosine-protein kinase SYK-like [Galendromus occidentalis]